MAGISVVGMVQETPGLMGAMAKFKKHNDEVADAIRNVSGIGTLDGKPAHQDAPRPAFVPQQWPRMVYHADGREKMVTKSGEYNDLLRSGYRDQPYPKVQVALADPATEKLALQTALRQKDGELSKHQELLVKAQSMLEAQAEMIRDMQDRLAAIESGDYEPEENPAPAKTETKAEAKKAAGK